MMRSTLRSEVEAALPVGDRSYSRPRQTSRGVSPGLGIKTEILNSAAMATGIVRAWREILEIELDPGRVRAHLRALQGRVNPRSSGDVQLSLGPLRRQRGVSQAAHPRARD
jgi:hypothetical protein